MPVKISTVKLGFFFLKGIMNILLFGPHGYSDPDENNEPPCDGDDDGDLNCPLDSWIYFLVAIIIFLGVYNWWKKNIATKTLA